MKNTKKKNYKEKVARALAYIKQNKKVEVEIPDIVSHLRNLFGMENTEIKIVRIDMEDLLNGNIFDIINQQSPYSEYEEKIVYSADNILDKITIHGIDSLTSGEKEFLDNHAKSL